MTQFHVWPTRGSGSSYRSISASRARAAANHLHVAAAVDRRDRQTDGQTKGHRTVTQTLTAESGQRQQFR